MIANISTVHEPEAELLSVEEAIEDSVRLRELLSQRKKEQRGIPLRVPLWTLLEAIDYLDPDELRQTVARAEKRLSAVRG